MEYFKVFKEYGKINGTLLFLVMLSTNVFSQQQISINLDSLFVGAQAGSVDFYVENVIDNRLYSHYLGIAQVGGYNVKIPIVFEKQLKSELGGFFKRMFPFDSLKTPITLRINELFIKENTQILTEIGRLDLKFDILKREEEVYTWQNNYSLTSQKRALDATNGNFDRLGEILNNAVLVMSNKNKKEQPQRVINLTHNSDPPILSEIPNSGFYYTHSELLGNSVLENINFKIKEKSKNKGSNTVYITNSEGNPIEYFSYFDGDNFYLNSSFYSDSKYFIKTYRVDNFLLFTEDFIADNYIDGFTIAKGKSGYKYVKSRRPILFNLADGKFYTVRRDNMAQLLEMKYPEMFKEFKKIEKRDIQPALEILQFLFENEDSERVREILTR